MTTKNQGRIAGLLNLLMAFAGGFYLIYLRSYIIVPGDPTATAGHILSSEFPYRLAIVSNLIGQVLMLFFALTLFHLIRDLNRKLAMVFLVSAIMIVGLAIGNVIHHFETLLILSQPDYLKVFSQDQLNALAMNSIRLANSAGQALTEIFWTPYFFAIGLIAFRYRFIPRIIGIGLMTMAVGYAINLLDKFLIPQFHPLMFTRLAMLLGALGGLPMMFWLLIKGVRIPNTEAKA